MKQKFATKVSLIIQSSYSLYKASRQYTQRSKTTQLTIFGTRTFVLPTSALLRDARTAYSEIRSSLSKRQWRWKTQIWWNSLFVADFDFICLIWLFGCRWWYLWFKMVFKMSPKFQTASLEITMMAVAAYVKEDRLHLFHFFLGVSVEEEENTHTHTHTHTKERKESIKK